MLQSMGSQRVSPDLVTEQQQPFHDIKFLNYLIIFFAAKDGDILYSQQKQYQELNLAQIMNSLLPNSD